MAGPGAGKTEFLAQRASYLLETGICAAPHRILAISFKSDAAENLGARVRRRCPPELGSRFTSLTFDAFTKGLVDRFQLAIPADWRPSRPYDIWFPTKAQAEGHLTESRLNAPGQWQAEMAGLSWLRFEPEHVGSYRLPFTTQMPQSGVEFAILRWWAQMLQSQSLSHMTFVGLNRLAELLLRAVPHVRRGLQLTYPFVFVDEFQDTTYAQYDFLLSAFHGSSVSLTAVGDDKQRIMTWAGARPDAFERVRTDLAAQTIPLTFNFRSSPDLVAIQHVVARALDPQVAQGLSQTRRQVDGDVAQVWASQTVEGEAAHLAQWLVADMQARARSPRDYVLLVKQKPENIEPELAGSLNRVGLALRNESAKIGRTTLQDLLCDRAVQTAVSFLRLGAQVRAPSAWQHCLQAMRELRAVTSEDRDAEAACERDLSDAMVGLRFEMARNAPSPQSAETVADQVFALFDLQAMRRTYLEYSANDFLALMVEAFRIHLANSATAAADWTVALDRFEGADQVPLMTVHKSKGLEYDTVIFLGLDDSAWWSHRPGDVEGLSTFFVALSRAKQRAIFAFCSGRGRRQNVAELYKLLEDAGVPEIPIG